MKLCPDDEEASCFFVFLFLQRLPAWLRVQLEADDQADIRQLAARADCLFALPHGHKHSESVAPAVEQAGESSVNAIQRDHHGSGGANRRGGHSGSRRDGAEAEPRASPGDAAAAVDEICYYHWKFGDEARSCKGSAAKPCNWQVQLAPCHQVVASGVALMRSPHAVSRHCGKPPPNGEQHSAASSTAMRNGPAPPDQLDNGEQHSVAFLPALQDRIVPHRWTRFTTASSTAPPLLLHRRPVLHRRISNKGWQHSAASSPALQASPASPDQFPRGRLPAQP
jgi:hypothetical protein